MVTDTPTPCRPPEKAYALPPSFFVELAARMQTGKHEFDHGYAFDRVQPDGNAAPVVVYGKRTVVVDAHVDFSGETAQRLVRRVVDDFLADVGRAVGAGVHAGTFFDRLQAFEDGDAGFAVLVVF